MFLTLIFIYTKAEAQISPGELSKAHLNLEGISSCTKCHSLGNQIGNMECLNCHTEIKKLMDTKRGYHSTEEVTSKKCFNCHSEHHGRNFRIVNFNPKTFNHNKTSYPLKGKHATIDCFDCHKNQFITDDKIKKVKGTFLGLSNACKTCHEDYHQGTLSPECKNCHNEDKFKPAPNFDHSKSKYALTGAHTRVECIKCHYMENRNGKKFQRFKDIAFSTCESCHKDIHTGKLGKNCVSCHESESWHIIKNSKEFDHSKTKYPLLGKHLYLKCDECHKGEKENRLRPKYAKCIDCHSDYHKGEFMDDGKLVDCKTCHVVEGADISIYTIEQHNKSKFALKGSHLAVPCQGCHEIGDRKNEKRKDKWKFRIEGEHCNQCHKNIHGDSITKKIKASDNCEYCHVVDNWKTVNTFNHDATDYKLLGKHIKVLCKDCHKETTPEYKIYFVTTSECLTCHKDIHMGQFADNGNNNKCESCHNFDSWRPVLFNHEKTKFPLEGGHKNVVCIQCHKQVEDK